LKEISGGITSVKGIKATGIHCGIKKSKSDLALIVSEPMAVASGVFTTNKLKAAPVIVSMEHIKSGRCKGIIVNSGNANAFTGRGGYKDSKEIVKLIAKELKTSPKSILIASTGKIGTPLPIDKIKKSIPLLVKSLSSSGGKKAAEAILTTDTMIKERAIEYNYDNKAIRIGGIAKGSGMIFPKMATMLSFITTDVSIKDELLKKALKRSVDKSFNMISVDGDTSTNDTVICMANGCAGNKLIDRAGRGFKLFQEALDFITLHLAKRIVRDGEGATKFIEVKVQGARSKRDAKRVASFIANSNLVKTAFFGEQANWGRILSAAGNAGVDLDFGSISLYLNGYKVVERGIVSYKEDTDLIEVMKKKEIKILLNLGKGDKEESVWTTDLSHEYIKINAEYIS
jgi:glutamate N-acetyltransferase/amino-acid N-acetyltransferase